MPSDKQVEGKRCTTRQFTFTLLAAFGLLVLTAFSFSLLLFPTERDTQIYHNLTQDSSQKEQPKNHSTVAQQKRSSVVKEIVYMRGSDQLALKLLAAHSNLKLQQLDSATQIIEHLSGVVALMQEELYYILPDGREAFLQANGRFLLRNGNPTNLQDWVDYSLEHVKAMQTFRYLEADKATYFYKDNYLLAEDVKISRYSTGGHSLVESLEDLSPMMTGWAKSAEISMSDPIPQFKATQLKAAFYE